MDIIEKINDIPHGFAVSKHFDRDKINVAKLVAPNGSVEYVYLADTDNKSVQALEGTRVEPIILYYNIQRGIYYVTGPSGVGKSLIAYVYSIQFHKLFPDDKIYYVCSTDIKDDENFGELDYVKALDPEKMYSMNMPIDEERELIKKLSNSLFIFDDIDMLPKEKKAIYTRLQGKIVETGRKYNINCLIISHVTLGGPHTKMILNEINQYFCFNDNIMNNGYLLKYLKIKPERLEEIKTNSWACFNNKYNLIITPSGIEYKNRDKCS